MSSARPAPEIEAEFAEVGEQRRVDRRGNDRRAARLRLEPLFAVSLLRHLLPAETPPARFASAAPAVRAGIVVDLRA